MYQVVENNVKLKLLVASLIFLDFRLQIKILPEST